MATYESDKISQGRPPITFPDRDITVPFTFTLTAIADGDIWELAEIPKYATLLDYFIGFPDMDSGSDFEFKLGDDDDDDRYITSSTVGQSAGNVTAGNSALPASIPYKNVDESTQGDVASDITFKLTVIDTGDVTSATIKGYIRYTMSEQYQEVAAT